MSDEMEIKGGAGPFQAAAVVTVVTQVLEEEAAARLRRPPSARPPAWMRAVQPRNPDDALEIVVPDHRGDPI